MERYYTVPEVAEMLNCSRTAVYGWIKEGLLKSMQVRQFIRIKGSDLQAFIDNNSK
jgi:DNA binding domain, excisionase family